MHPTAQTRRSFIEKEAGGASSQRQEAMQRLNAQGVVPKKQASRQLSASPPASPTASLSLQRHSPEAIPICCLSLAAAATPVPAA